MPCIPVLCQQVLALRPEATWNLAGLALARSMSFLA